MTASYPTVNAAEQLLVQVGDGGSPEVFTSPVLINQSRQLDMTANATATVIPRTDNPSAPGKTVRAVTDTDSKISGTGLLNTGDDKVYADWLLSGAAKNIKASNAITGGLVLTGAYVLTAYSSVGAKVGDKITCSITFEQADQPTTSAHA